MQEKLENSFDDFFYKIARLLFFFLCKIKLPIQKPLKPILDLVGSSHRGDFPQRANANGKQWGQYLYEVVFIKVDETRFLFDPKTRKYCTLRVNLS